MKNAKLDLLYFIDAKQHQFYKDPLRQTRENTSRPAIELKVFKFVKERD